MIFKSVFPTYLWLQMQVISCSWLFKHLWLILPVFCKWGTLYWVIMASHKWTGLDTVKNKCGFWQEIFRMRALNVKTAEQNKSTPFVSHTPLYCSAPVGLEMAHFQQHSFPAELRWEMAELQRNLHHEILWVVPDLSQFSKRLLQFTCD